ncbi:MULTISPECIES: TIGR03862 family flavoprotein [unclassified Xanthobacter]|uniref:NAD(P)/FAD-dependent oxidoreductase n=1 Tax=unclassified Xanthobacter TaxID=2623496 RepID=UPI001F21AEE6|nr:MULTISPECIES: TIGR03862 family flavoprotein [unclassified Xanthobacter]
MASTFVSIIGAGPAGLMAAERLSAAGLGVHVHERMPSPARKFLMAGRGGLNLTHSEPFERFLTRYGPQAGRLAPALSAFTPDDLRAWAEALGEPTFVGSSGRVFPESFKASPLLRAWLRRLAGQGVNLNTRHQWLGWDGAGRLRFATPEGELLEQPAATLLALGGASWPRLGADGGWVGLLRAQGVEVRDFVPANMGVCCAWSDLFRSRFAGTPLKRIVVRCGEARAAGEAVVTEAGLEGGAIYAVSRAVREALAADGATLHVDLRPDLDVARLAGRLSAAPSRLSFANLLRKAAGLSPVAAGLLREAIGPARPADAGALAEAIKAVPLTVTGVGDLSRAISSAGGLAWDEVGADFQLRRRPGVFVAGEMLDWEAPTGGYLLQACFATGRAAAEGILARLS